jgi:hypothetical protein
LATIQVPVCWYEVQIDVQLPSSEGSSTNPLLPSIAAINGGGRKVAVGSSVEADNGGGIQTTCVWATAVWTACAGIMQADSKQIDKANMINLIPAIFELPWINRIHLIGKLLSHILGKWVTPKIFPA